MSKCISRHGEYSEHTLTVTGDHRFLCQLCWVLDEEQIFATLADAEEERDRLREQIAAVRALVYSEDAHAVLYGVTGTHPESYGGVSKDEALECGGELLTNLRAALDTSTPATEGGEE